MRTTPHAHATTHAPRRNMSYSTASGPVHTCDVCTRPHHGHCERTIVDPRPVVGSTARHLRAICDNQNTRRESSYTPVRSHPTRLHSILRIIRQQRPRTPIASSPRPQQHPPLRSVSIDSKIDRDPWCRSSSTPTTSEVHCGSGTLEGHSCEQLRVRAGSAFCGKFCVGVGVIVSVSVNIVTVSVSVIFDCVGDGVGVGVGEIDKQRSWRGR
jgi:hypothetical protein